MNRIFAVLSVTLALTHLLADVTVSRVSPSIREATTFFCDEPTERENRGNSNEVIITVESEGSSCDGIIHEALVKLNREFDSDSRACLKVSQEKHGHQTQGFAYWTSVSHWPIEPAPYYRAPITHWFDSERRGVFSEEVQKRYCKSILPPHQFMVRRSFRCACNGTQVYEQTTNPDIFPPHPGRPRAR
jgi:hypothetical protein